MKEFSPGFRRRKWALALRILGAGMGIALLWTLVAQLVLHERYPYDSILGNPADRYSDFTDDTLSSFLPNPYSDPTSVYSPLTALMFRLLAFSDNMSLILVFFLGVAALALLLVRMLEPIIPGAWHRVSVAFVFLALSYPLLFCLDRGNTEIIMASLIGWALYFYSRHRDLAGTVCLFPAICLKFYPVILLVFLLRRRKAGLAIVSVLAAVALMVICAGCFGVPSAQIWTSYRQNLDLFRDYNVLSNFTINGSASLWNAYKIALIALELGGFIPFITFGFDGAFIQASYSIYVTAFALLGLICAGYAWLAKGHPTRGILILLLYLSVAVPSGSDYRLMYASMALVLLVMLPLRRPGDWFALVLIALAVIPKKEILLSFIAQVEPQRADVPVQVLLNPVFILTAMMILLFRSRPLFSWRRTALRLRHLLPWRWRWT